MLWHRPPACRCNRRGMRVRGTAIFEDLRLVRVTDGLHRLRDEVRNVVPASITLLRCRQCFVKPVALRARIVGDEYVGEPQTQQPRQAKYLTGLMFTWSTRPDSNRRPSGWQGDAGVDFIEEFRLKRSYRCVSVNSGGRISARESRGPIRAKEIREFLNMACCRQFGPR